MCDIFSRLILRNSHAVLVLHVGSVQLALVPVENVIRRQHSCSDRLGTLGLRPDVLSSENGTSPAAARHKLYKSMAASLLRRGLTLGGKWIKVWFLGDANFLSIASMAHILQHTCFAIIGYSCEQHARSRAVRSICSNGRSTASQTAPTGCACSSLCSAACQRCRRSVPGAVVWTMDHQASQHVIIAVLYNACCRKLLGALQWHVLPLVPQDGAWLQDPRFYHSTIFHASTHTNPVPALSSAIDAEAGAALRALNPLCPVRAVLERIVATSGGVLMACWQVLPGSTEPRRVRHVLRAALPDAPREQVKSGRIPFWRKERSRTVVCICIYTYAVTLSTHLITDRDRPRYSSHDPREGGC